MPRPSLASDRRRELLPVIARAFAELGYRRTTTAELGQRCDVRENILYRLWPDKKAMFMAAIAYVYEYSVSVWEELLARADDGTSRVERLLEYESRHHGELGLYRIVFAGLSESDDPDIRTALVGMYERYHRFLSRQIREDRGQRRPDARLEPTLTAWALVGLGTVASISRELSMVSERQHRRLIADAGRVLLNGKKS